VTPMDLMHAFLQGIIPYVIKIILSPFNNADKHCLDDLVDKTCYCPVFTEDKLSKVQFYLWYIQLKIAHSK